MKFDAEIVTICLKCAEIKGAQEQVRAAEREAKRWRDTTQNILEHLSQLAAQRPAVYGTFEQLLFGRGWRMAERTRNAQMEVESYIAKEILRGILRFNMQKHYADEIADGMVKHALERGEST